MNMQKYAAVVFSYNRKEMLIESLKPFRTEQTIIIDDGSDFTLYHPNFVQVKHNGKEGFWNNWPWDERWFKPSNDVRNLVKAGALIAAEIDRVNRAAGKKEAQH